MRFLFFNFFFYSWFSDAQLREIIQFSKYTRGAWSELREREDEADAHCYAASQVLALKNNFAFSEVVL